MRLDTAPALLAARALNLSLGFQRIAPFGERPAGAEFFELDVPA